MAVYETVKDGFLTNHLPMVRDLYKEQCGYMLDAMDQHFPTTASWTRPEGGMFIWVTLPAHLDGTPLLARDSQNHVAVVPGEPFFAGAEPQTNTQRLSFVTVSAEKLLKSEARRVGKEC